jgi:hypothetical protein
MGKKVSVGRVSFFAFALVLGGAAGRGLVVPASAAPPSGPAFTCEPGFYQVIAGQLNELNPVTDAYTAIGPLYAPVYNAMGYNVLDNYIYAMGTGSPDEADLLKIASDGTVTNLGLPSGLPVHSYVSGDMDSTGHLLVQYSASTWYSINVSTLTATAITVTGSTGSGNDAVWIGGSLYFANGQTLYTLNLSSDTETSVSVSTLPSGGSFGAAWSDYPDELYFSNNATGDIYQVINFTTSTPTATQVATGIVTGNNDGAACKLAGSPFAVPVANDDTYSVTADTTLSVDAAAGVLANDTGAGLTVVSNTEPAQGSLSLSPDGAFTYIPNIGFHGVDSFTYSEQDEYGRHSTGSATVTLDVNLPAAPQANNDSYDTTAGTTLSEAASGGLLANDSGTGISISSSTPPAAGTLNLSSDGAFSYVPAAGSSGVEHFSYTIDDAFGRTSTADVQIDVTPTVEDGSATTPYDTPLTEAAPGVLAGAEGSGLWISSYSWSSGASVEIDLDGALTFTPSASLAGPYQFQFTAEDSSGQTVSGSFSVGVGAPAAPLAASYPFTTGAGTTLSEDAADGVLSKDSGASIAVTSHSDPSDGSVSVNPDGSFAYTPDSGFSGYDSFEYTITDAVGQTSTGWVDIDVTPVGVDETFDTPFETAISVDVLSQDLGSGLSVQSDLTAPAGSLWSLDAAGDLSYTPPAGFAGPAVFTYSLVDGSGQPAIGTVTFDVGEPAAPLAHNLEFTGYAGQPITAGAGGLLTGSTGYALQVVSGSDGSDGLVSVNPDGSFSYTPDDGFSGYDTFTYTIEDGFGRTSTADVDVELIPTVEAGGATTAYATTLMVSAPGLLLGADGSGLTVSSYGQPSDGSVTVAADGSLTYTPDAGFDGTDQFDFTATDASGLSADGTFSIDVEAPPAPVAVTYGLTTPAGTSLDQDAGTGVLSEDSGTSITVTGHSDPSDGSVSMSPDGAFTYTPDAGFSGHDSFDYTITDAVGQMATGWVDVDVTPVAVAQTFGTGFETPITVDVLTGDLGSGLTGGDVLTTPTGDGSWSFSDGSLTFTPADGFVGPAVFTYSFVDGSDQPATGIVTFDVADPAPPSAGEVDFATPAGQTLDEATGALLANSTGYRIVVQSTLTPADGELLAGSSGSFSYTPDPGFSGPDSFDFTITDPFGQTSTGEAMITVDPVANDIGYSMPCGSTLTVPAAGGLLSTDLGTSLTVVSVSSDPALGTLSWNADGSFAYTPAAGQCGQANPLDYTLSDQGEDQASATVTFDAGPPAAVLDLSYSVDQDGSLTLEAGGGLLQWVTGPGITVVAYTQPSNGSVTAGTDGSFTYTPDPGYSGPDSFTYTAEDAYGVIGVGTVSISVEPALTGVSPTATPPTPDTGAGGGGGLWMTLAGIPLILLGVVSVLAVRRRRRPSLAEE